MEKTKEAKYKDALENVLYELRAIDMGNVADEYIDESIKIIEEVLKEEI